MTAFVLTPDKLDEVQRAVAEARRNVIPLDFIKGRAVLTPTDTLTLEERGPIEPRPKKYESIGVEFVGGVTAAISFEEQPVGVCRHLSVATGKPGSNRLPHPILLGVIAEAFGFESFPPLAGRVWVEEFKPNHFAVNIVELAGEPSPIGHA